MASCFHSHWLLASINTSRRFKTGAGRGNVFATPNGLKLGGSLKMSRGIRSNGYISAAGKCLRICCSNDTGEYEPEEQNPHMEDSAAAHEMVKKFYKSINNRNVPELLALLSDDCCYEDALFHSPFNGKQDIGRFAARLMDAMGPNVKFKEQVFTLGSDSAAAQWLLTWKSKEIPTTQGFNIFEFTLHNDKLLISKIGGLDEELMVKPGVNILKVLKIISTTLDKSPGDGDGEASIATLLEIYWSMRADSSLIDIANMVAAQFNLNIDGDDPKKPS